MTRANIFNRIRAHILGKCVWPLYRRDLGQSKALKVMEVDWDYLIVLDACRYDIFR